MRVSLGPLLLFAVVTTGCSDGDRSPEQPLPFPHKLHTDNQIDCAFCHEFTDSGAQAGIPRTELCGNCHLAMPQESDAAQTLIRYVEAEEPIPWKRLYQLPQFTYFSHKWHVRADIACEACHGDIGNSLVAERHMVLEMDWCMDCHEQRQASVDCVVCHK